MKIFKQVAVALLLLVSISITAQQNINYKALVKDDSGNVVASQNVDIQFIIYEGVALTNNVYQESHTASTDANGIIIVNIGEGDATTIVEGIPFTYVFADIVWGADDHFLNVQIDTGSGLTDMGTTQFMAVPYALSVSSESIKINDLADGKSGAFGSSLFLGIDAGLNDDGGGNQNVGIGFNALYSNTLGWNNSSIGHEALYNNIDGYMNTANGYQALYSNTSGHWNTAIGVYALDSNISGSSNTAIGISALGSNIGGIQNTAIGNGALYYNTTSGNTAMGFNALFSNTIGVANTATGNNALLNNVNGNHNTANGNKALYSNINGNWNTAIGSGALESNTEGDMNTAIGFTTLYNNIDGNENTAVGRTALFSNTTGDNNTAIGKSALYYSETGEHNTANGYRTMAYNTIGSNNTAIGSSALSHNTSGNNNTSIGMYSLFNNREGSHNTAIGFITLENNQNGSQNTVLGSNAGQIGDGDNNTAIGYGAKVPTGDNQIRIGNNQIQSATTQVAWTFPSDKRWKENIRELPYGLEVVKQLRPVDYMRKNNDARTRDMGFIAQDVEALLAKIGYKDQGFLTKDDKGYLSIRYNDFIALLTKAIQEQQEIIESQSDEIKSLTSELVETTEKQNSNYKKLLKRVEQIEANSNQ